MAVNIGPKIGIEGEAEYRKQIQEIIQTQKTLKAEMSAMSSAWDKDSNSIKNNKQAREQLNKMVENQKKRVEELKKGLSESEKATGENSQETQKWKQAVAEAETELNKLNNELKNVPNAMQTLGSAMQDTGDKIKGAGEAFMPLSAAAAAGLGASVKLAADFDGQMSKVQAISGASAEEMVTLSAKAREMGSTTKFSASEAGAAMEYMAMAGWKTADMTSGISGVMNLAAASGENLATVSDIVTDGLTAFGLSASDSAHFADVMAAASSNANTNVSMMGETFKYAAPVAGALGYDMEDVAIATGLMANAGIKGSQSGTALRSLMTRLAKPTKESGTAMKALGISITDAEGNTLPFMDVMEQLRDKFGNLSEAEAAQYAAMLAGQNGMSGLLAIVNASNEDFTKLSNAVTTASDAQDGYNGTAERMAAIMGDNLNGKLTVLKSSLEEAGISLGTALTPAIEKVTAGLQGAVNWFNSLDDSTKSTIATVGAVVAAIGPFLVILGTVVSSAGAVVGAIGSVGAVLSGPVVAGFGAAIAAAGPFIAIGAAVVAAGVLIYKNWDTIKAKAAELATNLKTKFEDIKRNATEKFNAIKQTVSTTMDNVKNDITTKFEAAKQSFNNTVNNIKETAKAGFEFVKNSVNNHLSEIQAAYETHGGGITGAASAVMTAVKGVFTDAYNFINQETNGKLGEVVGVVTRVMDDVKRQFTDKIEAARQAISEGVERIKSIFDFEWSFPPIKLPHFSVSGEFSVNPPSVPHFGIEWYAKAMQGGMILNNPTIFGAMGNRLLGAGEAGAEVVVGASSLYGMIQGAVASAGANYGGVTINVYPTPGQDAKEIAREVADILNGDIEKERAAWA